VGYGAGFGPGYGAGRGTGYGAGRVGYGAGTGTGYGAGPGASGGAAAFSPSDLAAPLELWFDANDLATLWQDSGRTTPVTADADPVGAWDDKSGNTRHATQAVAGTRPLYKTAQFGAKAGIDFVSSDFLATPSFTRAQPSTWFVVVDADGTGPGRPFASTGPVTLNILFVVATNWAIYAGGVLSDGAVSTSPAVVQTLFNGASSKVRKDGGAGSGGDAGTDSHSGALNIGIGSDGATEPFDGRIAELLCYDGNLSTTDLDLVGNYLAAKWGTTWTAAS
jgi:hypothetical protein